MGKDMVYVDMKVQSNVKDFAMVFLGSFLFAFGVNIFIVPLGLYSGGIIGFGAHK